MSAAVLSSLDNYCMTDKKQSILKYTVAGINDSTGTVTRGTQRKSVSDLDSKCSSHSAAHPYMQPLRPPLPRAPSTHVLSRGARKGGNVTIVRLSNENFEAWTREPQIPLLLLLVRAQSEVSPRTNACFAAGRLLLGHSDRFQQQEEHSQISRPDVATCSKL